MTKEGHFLSAARMLLMLLIFFLPLFFLPFTLEPLELNKQTLLVTLTCAAAVCWLVSMLLNRQIKIRTGWVNLLPWFLVAAFLVPALFSVAPYLSWIGSHRNEYTSVLTMLAVAVLFYLLANLMGGRREHARLHLVLLLSSTLVAGFAVLETFGIPVLSRFGATLQTGTIGTRSSLTAWLVVMTTMFTASFLSHHPGDSLLHESHVGRLERLLMFFVITATLFFLWLLDDSILWVLLAISQMFLFVFVVFRAKDFPHQARLVVPGILFFGSLVGWFVLTPLSGFSLPLEVAPNTDSSVAVAEQTLVTYSRSWGTGPGTYAFNFSQFHDSSLNETDFWNTRFDRASSFLLTLVPTVGVLGVTMFALFVLCLFLRGMSQVVRPGSREQWLESFVHVVPWLTLVVSAFLISWNMTLVTTFGIFSGLLASQILPSVWSKSLAKATGAKLVVSGLCVLLAVGFFVGIFFITQRSVAESAFTRAVELDREGGSLQEIVTFLDRASTLNPFNDTYARNLGEALLLRLDEELQGVSSMDLLTQESVQYVQSLTAASINAVVAATELSPHHVLNWLSRGHVYRELIPVVGEASAFAIASYQKAIELEPLNPGHWTELGKTYLAAAEQVRPLVATPDPSSAQLAQAQLAELLQSGQASFEKAIELKSNYAPAHFQLAVTYERQGRMNDAIGKMERVAQYNQLDVGVLFQLGMLYLQRNEAGDQDRAQAILERAVALAPSYANAHWFLASLYEAQGNLADAVREVEAVLDLNPGNEIVKTRLDRLLTGQLSSEIPEAIEE